MCLFECVFVCVSACECVCLFVCVCLFDFVCVCVCQLNQCIKVPMKSKLTMFGF